MQKQRNTSRKGSWNENYKRNNNNKTVRYS